MSSREEMIVIAISLVGVIAVFLIAGWASGLLTLIFMAALVAVVIAVTRTYR